MTEEPHQLLTVLQASQVLELTSDHVRHLAAAGKLAHYRSGDGGTHSRYLFAQGDLDEYKERKTNEATKVVRIEAKEKK